MSKFPTTYDSGYDEEQVMRLAMQADTSLRNLTDAKARIKGLKLFRKVAWLIVAADVYLSYTVALAYSDSETMSSALSITIGVIQIVINMAIFSGQLGRILQCDFNGNGKQEWYEKLGSWAFVSVIVGAYGWNIGTNFLGINSAGLSQMGRDLGAALVDLIPFGLLPFGGGFFSGMVLGIFSLTGVALAILLCLADEVIVVLCDRMIATTKNAIPRLEQIHALQYRELEKATGFAEGIRSQDAKAEGFAAAQQMVGR